VVSKDSGRKKAVRTGHGLFLLAPTQTCPGSSTNLTKGLDTQEALVPIPIRELPAALYGGRRGVS